jgi:hypothetical protein
MRSSTRLDFPEPAGPCITAERPGFSLKFRFLKICVRRSDFRKTLFISTIVVWLMVLQRGHESFACFEKSGFSFILPNANFPQTYTDFDGKKLSLIKQLKHYDPN